MIRRLFIYPSPRFPHSSLAIGLEQRSSATCAILFLAILVPALVVVLAPVFSLISLALGDAQTRGVFLEKFNSLLLAGLGLGIWVTLWGIPAWRFLNQLFTKRFIRIRNFEVEVEDKSLLGPRYWSCRLNEFEGLARRVRTTISGARHELVLLHPQRAKSILVYMAPAISDLETWQFARVLKQELLTFPHPAQGELTASLPTEHEGVRELEPLAA